MLVNSITECKTIIGTDDSVRLLVDIETTEGPISLELDDNSIRRLIAYGVEHLHESRRDIYAECLHACLQELTFMQLGLTDEDE